MTYRFLSPAEQDLADAVAYYERAVPGLGLDFLDEVERTVHRIMQQPEAWAWSFLDSRVSPAGLMPALRVLSGPARSGIDCDQFPDCATGPG